MEWVIHPENPGTLEIGVDEAGRGPLLGRVYAAAVVVSPEMADLAAAQGIEIKDSKKFHSKKKIQDAAEFIKTHARFWAVAYEEAEVIDEINIRQANFRAVHHAVVDILSSAGHATPQGVLVAMDGNDFIPLVVADQPVAHQTFVGGDAKYAAIACASILAKTSRDQYIQELCTAHPELNEKYGLAANMGYGTARHIKGIRTHGPSPFHRMSFLGKILQS